ncbi:hypothetical protein R5W24_004920 [Gemmata sp. JC717]|uniref:hypothetical protein n=1 Tax=Gemmata algarum TaxID=2975278 RepID=UPI0021BB731F|nr:hypothetical protein [Gemmata algarum]MDY3555774.1 hypothetical protein [Gemmata algarum]
MSYEVRCACGQTRGAGAADAGASLPCACGRAIEVPPLHQLRLAAGEDVLSAAVRVKALLLKGLLPGTRECSVCFRETGDVVHVAVECERGRMTTASGTPREQVAAGCLLGVLIGGLPGLIAANRMMKQTEVEGPKQIGQDVAFTLPLPVCVACRFGLDDRQSLVRALRAIPDYAALLDRYPAALLRLVG